MFDLFGRLRFELALPSVTFWPHRFEICRDPGSNRGPSDLRSDALPTELSRQVHMSKSTKIQMVRLSGIIVHMDGAAPNWQSHPCMPPRRSLAAAAVLCADGRRDAARWFSHSRRFGQGARPPCNSISFDRAADSFVVAAEARRATQTKKRHCAQRAGAAAHAGGRKGDERLK